MVDNNYNPFSLYGKTILVTGASSGIGRATAIECSKMGARVILSARNEDRLNETLSMLEGGGHLIIAADLLQESDVSTLVQLIPKVNGMVYSAGKLCLKPIKFYSYSAIENMFKLNAFAPICLVKELLKSKKISYGASLAFVSSISSYIRPAVGEGIYSASKAALDAFSRQCSIELHSQGIRANSIEPGLIATPMSQDIEESSTLDKELLNFLGKPEDVARLAVYLLSDASSFVTGASFVIDGGYNLNK